MEYKDIMTELRSMSDYKLTNSSKSTPTNTPRPNQKGKSIDKILKKMESNVWNKYINDITRSLKFK